MFHLIRPFLVVAVILGIAPVNGEVLVHIQKKPALRYTALSVSQQQALTAAGATILRDYGPFAVAAAPDGFDATAATAATGLVVAVNSRAQRLDLAGFDVDATSPSAAPPADAPSDLLLDDYPAGTGLYLVQFNGPILGAWLDSLRAAGLRPIQYVSANAYIVGAASGLSSLRSRLAAPVRYVGVLQPAYKVSQGLRAKTTAGTLKFLALLDAGQDLTGIIATMKALDPAVDLTPVRQNEQQAVLSGDAGAWKALARRPEVLWLEEFTSPSLSDERADQITAGNYDGNGVPQKLSPFVPYSTWLSNMGLNDLSSEIVNIPDTGIMTSNGGSGCIAGSSVYGGHADLDMDTSTYRPRLVYACPAPPSPGCSSQNITDGYYHGTFVAGLIAGNPLQQTPSTYLTDANLPEGFYWGMGVAPTAHFGTTKIFSDSGSFCGSPDFVAIATYAYSNGARYQNDSWNFYTDTTYSATARAYDQIVRDAYVQNAPRPMTVVFSAGNIRGGSNLVQSPATAKNVITVGASGLARSGLPGGCNNSLHIQDIPSFSTRGTMDFNVFKPDLIAPGNTSTSAFSYPYSTQSNCSGYPPTPIPNTGNNYFPATGTSFSAPLVTGSAMLVHARIQNTNQFSAAPSLLKAILIGSAQSVQGGTDFVTGYTLGWEPGYSQGWGRLGLASFFDSTPKVLGNEDPARTFTTSGVYQNWTFSVADTAKPILIALVWSDAPGPAGSTHPLVNQLNMWVLQGSHIYCDGQYGLQYSTASTGCWLPDFDNNVKTARIAPYSFTGAFTIQLQAASISAQAVPGWGGPSQDWSMFVYNAYLTGGP